MKKTRFVLCVATLVLAFGVGAANADVFLGTFDFNSSQFGNTLLESDGGAFSAGNWLNIANADPGNPGYLTGANFDTGIANIGFSGAVSYTIFYNTSIVNQSGFDIGIVTARYSTSDTATLEVSSDGGTTFSSSVSYGPELAVGTGVPRDYFYGGGGPFDSLLFVTSIDLSDFGILSGAGINAIRITGSPELDLIRVAGFNAAAVPEPGTLMLLGFGIGALALPAWRRRS